ncbi:MAG: UPF0149 family protein [Azoarcus sp.]|jgi:uncharacterized protein|nr:UPF0149 family protein [Azoarcus sp.]MDX9836777.1 UPF0149 family protein [Azoarcus sp.]
MTTDSGNPHLMSDEAFEELEEMLTSDIVPEDCMNLEMLDGFLAGVLLSPQPIPVERWLPAVWSAHEDGMSFGSGKGVQKAIRLVLSYYNEMTTTLGLDDDDENCWEPFCFAITDVDTIKLGDEWVEGFTQGLDAWRKDWREALPEDAVEAVRETLNTVLAPWAEDGADKVDDDTRLGWLAAMGEAANDIFSHWRDMELPAPQPLPVDVPPGPSTSGPGRNDPCPCGSGKKFKKCCGATAE